LTSHLGKFLSNFLANSRMVSKTCLTADRMGA